MEIKKCSNCGSFTTSADSLCDVCAKQLKYNTTLLNNYFESNVNFGSISAIASATGVSPSVVQNYMIENNYLEVPTNATDAYYGNLPY
ncbi:MAG: hypothetical protein IJ217_03820 [Clostridia bacterium]|nr:hypothetical protein [Clostridia bacterium]